MAGNRQVLLSGGGPWGLKLNGGKDFCAPLVVSKVTPSSKAALGGVRDGDYVLTINDTPTDDLKHHDAQALIRGTGQSLRLTVSNVAPKRSTASAETVAVKTVPVTRPAPPTIPVTTSHVPMTTSHTTTTPPKVVHTTGGVTINVQKSRPTPTNPVSANVTPPPSSNRPAPPPSRPTPPVTTVTPAVSVTTTPPVQPYNKEGGVVTDSILTDETDLNLSAESTLQSPAFRRITITEDDNTPHPSTIIKPPVIGHHTPPPPSATVTKGILKSPVKPPVTKPPSQPKPPPPKPANVAGINRPAPPPVTVVKAPPQPTQDAGTKKDYERQAECAKCNNPIRGPYATAMGSNWHPNCFCCSSCSQTLSNVTFVIEGSDVYCEQCYKQGVAPICEGCQQAITGNYMTAMGRYWHGEHFVCSQCQRGLSGGEEGGFHYEEANLFCTQCFTNSYGVQCFGCKQMIGGNELWVEAMEQNWHPECFVCTVCRKPLEGQSFFVKSGSPYCASCK